MRRYRPEVSRELAAFVARALGREPDDRFQTADAMLEALALVARAPAADPRVLKRRARARMIVAAVVAMLVGALVTLLAVALVGK